MRPWSIILAGVLALPNLACHGNPKVEQSLEKAIEYVRSRGEKLHPMMVPTLHHLGREYGLQVDITVMAQKIRERNRENPNPFLRELDPKTQITPKDIQKLSGIDHFTATAMHCDRFGLPKYYLARLRKLAAYDGYALTHAALALLLAGWRKCVANDQFLEAEFYFYYGRLQELLERIDAESDLGVETMLMLLLLRKNLKLPPELDRASLLRILDAQQADGSWNQDDHTTVLAIWVMLEAQRQGIFGAGKHHE